MVSNVRRVAQISQVPSLPILFPHFLERRKIASDLNHTTPLSRAVLSEATRRADTLSSEITGRFLSRDEGPTTLAGVLIHRGRQPFARVNARGMNHDLGLAWATARPRVAGVLEEVAWRREGNDRGNWKRWLEGEMKTLVVRLDRRAALSSREPKINRSPRLPETPFLRRVALRLSSTSGYFTNPRNEFKVLTLRFSSSPRYSCESPLLAIKLHGIIINSITSTARLVIRLARSYVI